MAVLFHASISFYLKEKITMKMNLEKLKIRMIGIRPIMFDKYSGSNKTELTASQKLYFLKDGKTVGLPAENIYSFLGAQNSTSVSKCFYGKRWREYAMAVNSFVLLDEMIYPFLKNKKPIQFGSFNSEGIDPKSGIFIDRRVPRLKGGVPNPKDRPVIPMPWELNVGLSIISNDIITKDVLISMFEQGGMMIGFGSYRTVFGKFKVELM